MTANGKYLVVSQLLLFIQLAVSYPTFQTKIPNGDIVPHPCKADIVWSGVGHQNALGGGARNPFGVAFASANHEWTTELCNADSDDDGKTNGEELGDPNCLWTTGGVPTYSANLTHPGVCEPVDSADCANKNSWTIDCSAETEFTCPGMEEQDTVNVTLKFDRTPVPSTETTYICQLFTIPDDREYHMFAIKPEIDNINVMHHTLLYGCSGDLVGFDTPVECGMATDLCGEMIGGWTLGADGSCLHETHGVRVGRGSYTKVLMEHHWNNPMGETNYYDASGMTLYLTPNLRTHSLGGLILGQTFLELPPGRENFAVFGSCPSSCSNRKLQETVYITSAHLHMHYLGSYGKIEHWRDGQKLNTLFDEGTYNYDSPVFNSFDTPIVFRPGDELKVLCGYNTMSKQSITYVGEATSDEMCFGFLDYYPASARFDSCVSYRDMDECELRDREAENGNDDNSSATPLVSYTFFVLQHLLVALHMINC